MQIRPQSNLILPAAWFECKFAWTSILNTWKHSSSFRATTVHRCDFACHRFMDRCIFLFFRQLVYQINILYPNIFQLLTFLLSHTHSAFLLLYICFLRLNPLLYCKALFSTSWITGTTSHIVTLFPSINGVVKSLIPPPSAVNLRSFTKPQTHLQHTSKCKCSCCSTVAVYLYYIL